MKNPFKANNIKRLNEAHVQKNVSNKTEEKPVYLLNKEEVMSERDRLEKKFDDKNYTKEDEARMKELATQSMRAFNILLSKLK